MKSNKNALYVFRIFRFAPSYLSFQLHPSVTIFRPSVRPSKGHKDDDGSKRTHIDDDDDDWKLCFLQLVFILLCVEVHKKGRHRRSLIAWVHRATEDRTTAELTRGRELQAGAAFVPAGTYFSAAAAAAATSNEIVFSFC